MSKELQFALKMTADVVDALRGAKGVRDGIKDMGNEADRTAAKLSKLDGGGFASVGKAAYESQKHIHGQIKALDQVFSTVDRGIRSFDELAKVEAKLDQLMATGLITEKEQLDVLDQLDKQEKTLIRTRNKEAAALGKLIQSYDPAHNALKKLTRDEQALKKAVDAGRLSREQYNRMMAGIGKSRVHWEGVAKAQDKVGQSMVRLNVRSAAVQKNIGQLISYTATGDFGMAANQLRQLGTQANLTTLLFSPLGASIGATVGLVAALGITVAKGYFEFREYENTLIAYNNTVGVTAGGLASLQTQLGDTTGAYGDARKAVLLLAKSGKVTETSLQAASEAAVQLAQLTGESIEQTTAKVIELADAPTATLIKLNDEYNFLTAEVYKQVRALEAEGKAKEAAELATEELARVTNERAAQMRAQAGLLENAWTDVKKAIGEAIQEVKNFGRTDAAYQAERIRKNNAHVGQLRGVVDAIGLGDSALDRVLRDRLKAGQLEYDLKTEQANTEAEAAKTQTEVLRLNKQGVSALHDANIALESKLSKHEKEKKAIAEVNKLYRQMAEKDPSNALLQGVQFGLDGSIKGGDYDRTIAGIKAKYAEKAKKPRKSDSQKEAEQLAKWVDQLERQAQVMGLNRDQALAYEIAEKQLTGALKERAQAAAQLIASKRDEEQAKKDTETLAQIQTEYLRAIGKNSDAAEQELERRFDELMKRLVARGDTAGQALVNKLINAEKVRVQAEQMQTAFDQSMNSIDRAERRLQISREAGLISLIDYQEQVLQQRQREMDFIAQEIPRIEQLNALQYTPARAQQIEDLKLRLFELQNQATLLEATFANAFEGGLTRALNGLAEGTMNLRQATTALLMDVAKAMANLAAQQLASYATTKLMAGLTGKKAPSLSAPDPAQAAAAGAAYATPIAGAAGALSASAIPLNGAAAALNVAATRLQAANATGAVAGGGAGGWLQLLSGLIPGFAGGGHVRGAGTGTSDSIAARLSNGEYVIRAAAVKRYGVGVMDALNTLSLPRLGRMMPSINHVPKHRFASGGLVQAGGLGALKAGDVVLNNHMHWDLDDLVNAVANHPIMEKTTVSHVTMNGRSIQTGWAQS